MTSEWWRVRPQVAFLAFAASFAVFQHVPSVAGPAGDWIDLLTPFAVVGTGALVLASLGTAPAAIMLALVAGVVYVDGHGIHLAANSIRNEEALSGAAADVAYFWDEQFGHVYWHAGWMLLLGAVVLGEALAGAARGRPRSAWFAGIAAALLGATLFTSTVEGHTWWLALAATPVFVVWAWRAPRPLVVTTAGAFALAAVCMGIWAVWHGGMPEFSELGWI